MSAIKVTVESRYLPEQSDPQSNNYVFAYTVTIRNEGAKPAQLLRRHWIITDGNGNVQEVEGEGVVGEQPRLAPGQGFRYTSGTILPTPYGTMRGFYFLRADSGETLQAEIPEFLLTTPRTLH